jgi:hypothetical protein
MDELERIGKSRKLDKVMLTCLKGLPSLYNDSNRADSRQYGCIIILSETGVCSTLHEDVELGKQGADDRYEADEIDPTRMEEDPESDEEDNEADAEGAGELDEDEGWEEVSKEEGMVIDYVILSKALRRPAFG